MVNEKIMAIGFFMATSGGLSIVLQPVTDFILSYFKIRLDLLIVISLLTLVCGIAVFIAGAKSRENPI